MIHYPLTPINEIYKTKRESFLGSLDNQAKVIREGMMGFTVFELRPTDYAIIAEEWETAVINTYQMMQDAQFQNRYGEEY